MSNSRANYNSKKDEIKKVLLTLMEINNDIYELYDSWGPSQFRLALRQGLDHLNKHYKVSTFPEKYQQVVRNLEASYKDTTKRAEEMTKKLSSKNMAELEQLWQERMESKAAGKESVEEKEEKKAKCRQILQNYGLNFQTKKDFLKWAPRAHPNKGGNSKIFAEVSGCVDILFEE